MSADGSVGADGTVSEPAVGLKGVSRRYGDFEALSTTSLDIQEGEFFSLLGPSGCGKTTTLRLIAGFDTPSTGVVEIAGKDVTHTPPNRRDTNTVFQSYALFPHMTVAQNVAYPLRMKGSSRADITTRVAEALDKVDMTELADRLPHQLSGGQRQRGALARAIVGRPKVLLLDEPLGALDLKLREQMQHVLVALQHEIGITFVYVTHDQGEALSMSDRMAVMKNGVIQQLGSPWEVYYRPANSFVAGFIGKSNIVRTTVRANGAGYVMDAGPFVVPAPKDMPEGNRSIAIRYEALVIDDAASSCNISLDAVVKDALFFGNVVEITLNIGGLQIITLQPSLRGHAFRAGDAVRVGLNHDDVVILND